jgi:leader peptidase (prepilin peptidase)/N-methyltransferase
MTLAPAWEASTPWLVLLAASPSVGGLLGVLADRLPRGEPVALARSKCRSCQRRLGILEILPLVSYAVLRGRCRTCTAPIGWGPPGFELAAVAVALAAGLASEPWRQAGGCLLGWSLLTLAVIDARHLILPDILTLPLAAGGLALHLWQAPDLTVDRIAGLLAGYGAFVLIAVAWARLRGAEGLGRGDAKLLGAAGAWVGWQALPGLVFLAAVAGLLFVAAARLLAKRSVDGAVPFGPAIAFSTGIIWIGGPFSIQ